MWPVLCRALRFEWGGKLPSLFSGGAIIAAGGNPEPRPRVTFAARTDAPRDDMFAWLEQTLRTQEQADVVRLDDGAILRARTLDGREWLATVRHGLLLVASDRAALDAAAAADPKTAIWSNAARIDQTLKSATTADASQTVTGWLWLDVSRARPWLTRRVALPPITLPGLTSANAPSRMTIVGLADRVRVVVDAPAAMPPADQSQAPTADAASLATVYRYDTTFFAAGALPTAAAELKTMIAPVAAAAPGWPAILNALRLDADADNPSRQAGRPALPSAREIVDNFRGTWAFGARLETDGHWHSAMLALPVRDDDLLWKQFERVRQAADLRSAQTVRRGITIRHLFIGGGLYSLAVVDGILLISPEPQAIGDAIDLFLTGRSLWRIRRFQEGRKALGDHPGLLGYVHVSTALRSARTAGLIQPDATIESLAGAGAAIAAAVQRVGERDVWNVVLVPDDGAEHWSRLWSILEHLRDTGIDAAAAPRRRP